MAFISELRLMGNNVSLLIPFLNIICLPLNRGLDREREGNERKECKRLSVGIVSQII